MPALRSVNFTAADLQVTPSSCQACGQVILVAGSPMFPDGHGCCAASGAYEDAVWYRATGEGAVPCYLIAQLTAAEWQIVRFLSQAQARRQVLDRAARAAALGADVDIDSAIDALSKESE